jgi:pimeloyl-ACP methyl ester carboxylesterase
MMDDSRIYDLLVHDAVRRRGDVSELETHETHERADIFVSHAFDEQLVDLGEIRMNYATVGGPELPALLLVPAQMQSWWSYETVMGLLAEHFRVYAVDLRGQGRSTQTPGRYTLDNMGNDLVRFIDAVIGRPTIVSGNSSGGVLAAWLSAYAKPGQLRGAVCEDPPLFSSETNPAVGQSIRQSIGPIFALLSKWLGDQWSIGDWAGMQVAAPKELPRHVRLALGRMRIGSPPTSETPNEPPQNMKEYDPEWGRSFWTGAVSASCDHARMLASVKVPVLISQHFREIDSDTGGLVGAVSDEQVKHAHALITGAGQPCQVIDLPDMAHGMHAADPNRFAQIIVEWSSTLAPQPFTSQEKE